MRRVAALAVAALAIGWIATAAKASEQFLYVPSIAGPTSVPSYSGVMNLQSSLITPDGFSMNRFVDTASAKIQLAVTGGTPLGTTSLLLYNSTPTGAPDAVIPFKDTLASHYTILGGTPTSEQVSFATSTPALLYLQLPGITGPDSTPGFTGLMPLLDVGFGSGSFSVLKDADSTATDLFTDLSLGTVLPTARLLFYNNTTPGTQPDTQVLFHNVIITSDQVSGNTILQQQLGFSFESLSQPVPEPGCLGLALAGLAMFRRR